MGDYPVKLSKFHPDSEKSHRHMIDKDLDLLYQLSQQQKKINDKLENVYTYLTEDKLIYVDSVIGNDGDDGASATPLRTIQKAIDLCPFNLNGYLYEITLYNTTFSEAVSVPIKISGAIDISMVSEPVVWQAQPIDGGNPYCIVINELTTISMSGIKFNSYPSTTASQILITIDDNSYCTISDSYFGKTGTESNVTAIYNGGILKLSNCTDDTIPCDYFHVAALPGGITYLNLSSVTAPNITGSGMVYINGGDFSIEKVSYDNAINCSFSNGTITNATVPTLAGSNASFSNLTVTNLTAPSMGSSNGTWVANFVLGGGSATINNTNTGWWSKVGNQVSVGGYFVVGTTASPSGVFKISGLPYAVKSGDYYYTSLSVKGSGFIPTAAITTYGYFNQNTTTAVIQIHWSDTIYQVGDYIQNGSNFIIGGTYLTN